jgi:NADH dehydrogenase/NADH:ubiquinone oxidoreductase subunit G
MSDVKLTINGTPVTGPKGATILEVARENGIDIPTLCYLKDLPPVGACRLCVVEVEGSRTLVGSCHTPVAEGMVVNTHSPRVLETRRILIELTLASHPDSCLVCDKANLCELRRIAAEMDIGLPRFRLRKHYFPVEDANPCIVRDMSKCILCRRCVTACLDQHGARIFSLAYRGFESKVVYGLDLPVSGEQAIRDCDACIRLCPTGALSRPVRVGEAKTGAVLYIKG